jgi:glycosyltransferase involved in cell wall biosynthesis
VKPSIGVLITYYNEGELLTACLNSLLGGSELPDEILIYDDGSTLLPDAFIPPGAPVRVIRATENRGPGFARNELLRASRAEYAHFHDADDWFHPDWCAAVRAAIETSGAPLVLTELAVLDAERRLLGDTAILRKLRPDSDLTHFAILTCLGTHQSTFAREVGLAVGGFRTRAVIAQAEDCDFHVRLAHAASRFTVIRDPIYFIWMRSGSLSRQHSWTKAASLVCGIRSSELLAGELPERYHRALAERALRRAVKLYSLGYIDEARAGSAVARRIASAQSRWPNRHYPVQTLVGVLGFEAAAKVIRQMGKVRRALLPRNSVRRQIQT